MGTLRNLLDFKRSLKVGASASGNYTPTTLWELGIPVDSNKQMDLSNWSRTGNVVTVWGSMVTKFDNPNPWFDVSVPVTNGNNLGTISGFARRQRSTEQLSVTLSTNVAARATKVGFVGSGISGAANETWDFKFEYTLT